MNEPGGHLFGEVPLKAGETRKLQDWEPIFYTTYLLTAVMLGFGLNNRPESTAELEIEAEAQRRVALLNLDDDDEE